MIGSLYGMGADYSLSIQVATTDGSFITAFPTSNTDIFGLFEEVAGVHSVSSLP
jgi:hypothetical protein